MKLKDFAKMSGMELPEEPKCNNIFAVNEFSSLKEIYDNIELPIEKLKPSRTYPIVCSSCGGLGYITNPLPVCSSTTIICPACNGSKTVMAVENNINQEGSDET